MMVPMGMTNQETEQREPSLREITKRERDREKKREYRQNPIYRCVFCVDICTHYIYTNLYVYIHTGELGYDGPLYDGFLHMTENVLGPSPMHIKYLSYVYDGFCI